MAYLSYSGYKKYKTCQLAYWHQYIGKTKPPTPDNRVGMLYGSVVGVLFEEFYRDKLWKQPDPCAVLLARARGTMESIIAKESRSGIFDWKASRDYKAGPEVVLSEVLESVPRGLDIIRYHRLLGVDAAAEMKLDSKIGGHDLGGRADFIMTRAYPHRDLCIIDGKGSKYRDQYVDVDQLHWYSMLYESHFRRLPDQTAFLFWRSEKPEQALDWHPCGAEAIQALKDNVLETVAEIEGKKRQLKLFEPKPNPSKCKVCPYVFACPDGQHMLDSENRPTISTGTGVEDVSLDD